MINSRDITVVGGSVAGLSSFAALDKLSTKATVRLVTQKPIQSPRLIAGCSLRYATIQRIAKCYDLHPHSILKALSNGKGTFKKLKIGLLDSNFNFDEPLEIIPEKADRIIGLSTRHGHITSTLLDLVKDSAKIEFKSIDSLDTDYDDFQKPLMLNATGKNFSKNEFPEPTHYVLVSQVPLKIQSGGLKRPLEDNMAYAPIHKNSKGMNVMFFTPFYDPLTSTATWYGINTLIIPIKNYNSDDLDSVTITLQKTAQKMGLEFENPEITLAQAVVPIVKDFRQVYEPSYYDLYRGFSSGAPAIYVDGMLAMASGSLALVHALENDLPIDQHVQKRLKGMRFRNWLMQALMTSTPFFLLRWIKWLAPQLLVKLTGYDWVDSEDF